MRSEWRRVLEHGLGLDEDHGRSPALPGVGQQYPEQAVTRPEVRPLHASVQCAQLVTQPNVLEDEFPTAAADETDRATPEQDQFEQA